MPGNAQPRGVNAFTASTPEVTGIPLSKPLQDLSQIGSFMPLLKRNFATANADTTLTVNLGRPISGYLQIQTPPGGGQLTNGSNNGSDWSTTEIVLQATVAGIYGMLVF